MKRMGPRMAFNVITWEIFVIALLGTAILRWCWDHPIVHFVTLFGTIGIVYALQTKWWSTYSSRNVPTNADHKKFLQGLRDAERGSNAEAVRTIVCGLSAGLMYEGEVIVRVRNGKIVGIQWP